MLQAENAGTVCRARTGVLGKNAECCIEVSMTNALQASCVTDRKQFSLSGSGGAAAAAGLPSLRNRVEWRVC